MRKNNRILALFVAFSSCFALTAQVVIEGGSKPSIKETPKSDTGLHAIYVCRDFNNLLVKYQASGTDVVNWYSFDSRGGAYAQPMVAHVDGRESWIVPAEKSLGYIIEEGTKRTYIWVIDYSRYELRLNSAEMIYEGDCGAILVAVNGSGDDIVYYTINGGYRILNREIALRYKTLKWNNEDLQWADEEKNEKYEGFKSKIIIPAPLCETDVELSGDKFLMQWGEPQQVISEVHKPEAVSAMTVAIEEEKNEDNKNHNGDALGGSAPVTITFKAYPTDAVVHHEWQMARDADFENIETRYNREEISETFTENGVTYWRYVGANAAGDCEAIGDTYTVAISESELKCPNAFSPNGDGVNDVWRVSYKSIITFRCTIFNRWGNLIKEFNNPADGWDGKYKGKVVPSGTYYYVIDAEGAEGKRYKLKGDINIVNFKGKDKPLPGGDE